MKKSLISIFLLFFLLIPITGCGDDEEEKIPQYTVSVDLKKASSNTEKDYSLDDCARIVSGPGTYEKGQYANIRIEFVSNVCAYNYLLVDTVEDNSIHPISIATNEKLQKKYVEKKILVEGNVSISAIFSLDGTSIIDGGVYFYEFTKQFYQEGTTTSKTQQLTDDYAFPHLESEESTFVATDTMYTVSTNGQMLNELLGDGTKLDLNYVYLDGSFEPYKLTWEKGTYTSSSTTCIFDDSEVIPDPNEFSLSNNEKLCVAATIDKRGEISSELKTLAIENMLNSEMYVNSGTTACSEVNENCSYLLKLKNLYNSGVDHTNSNVSTNSKTQVNASYYGISDSGLREEIRTSSSGKKEYYLCKDTQDCSNNTFYIEYPYTLSDDLNSAYQMLAIDELIDALGTSIDEEGTTYSISSNNLTFGYNHKFNDIVVTSIKVGNKTYKIEYITAGEKPTGYTGGNSLPSLSAKEAIKYTEMEFVNDEGDPIVADDLGENGMVDVPLLEDIAFIINSKNQHLIYQKSTASSHSKEIQDLIYSLIKTNDTFKPLKKYYFNVIKDNQTNSIKIKVEDASVDNLIAKKFIKENDVVCLSSSTTCLSTVAKTIMNSVSQLSSSNIINLNINSITKEGNTYKYEFNIEGSGNIEKIEYDMTNSKITSSNTEIQYLDGTVIENIDLTKLVVNVEEITSFGTMNTIFDASKLPDDAMDPVYDIIVESEVELGTYLQIYLEGEELSSLELKIENTNISINIDLSNLHTVLDIIFSGTVYQFDGDENLYIANEEDDSVYLLTKLDSEENTYILEYEDLDYTIIFTFASE